MPGRLDSSIKKWCWLWWVLVLPVSYILVRAHGTEYRVFVGITGAVLIGTRCSETAVSIIVIPTSSYLSLHLSACILSPPLLCRLMWFNHGMVSLERCRFVLPRSLLFQVIFTFRLPLPLSILSSLLPPPSPPLPPPPPVSYILVRDVLGHSSVLRYVHTHFILVLAVFYERFFNAALFYFFSGKFVPVGEIKFNKVCGAACSRYEHDKLQQCTNVYQVFTSMPMRMPGSWAHARPSEATRTSAETFPMGFLVWFPIQQQVYRVLLSAYVYQYHWCILAVWFKISTRSTHNFESQNANHKLKIDSWAYSAYHIEWCPNYCKYHTTCYSFSV